MSPNATSVHRWLRWLAWMLAAVAIAALAINLISVWRFTVDDTYITLRYSRHLAEGVGPTFNDTGPRAEGYTSLTWMLLLAVPHLTGVNALVVAKTLGVVAVSGVTALVAYWVYDATRESGFGAFAIGAAVAAYAMLGRTAVHAVSGMETSFYTLLLTALFYTSVSTIRRPAHAGYWRLALLSTMVGLSRPEGNLIAGVLMLGAAVNIPKHDRASFMRAALLLWMVPLGLLEIWRLGYYGLPFPLPFYVKVASPSMFPGSTPVFGWLGDVAARIGLPVAVAIATSTSDLKPALVAAAAVVAFLLRPEHLNGYEYRYLAPLDPLLSVLFGIGIARILERRDASSLRVAAALVFTALACGLAAAQAPRSIRGRLAYADGMAAAHEPLGRDLAGLGFRGRIALSDAGAIPYLSEWWTLDLVGLNDVEIAMTGNRDPNRVLGANLDVLVFVSGSSEQFETVDWNTWEGPLYEAAIRRGFACVSIRRFEPGYNLWVLARPGSPAARALARPSTHFR